MHFPRVDRGSIPFGSPFINYHHLRVTSSTGGGGGGWIRVLYSSSSSPARHVHQQGCLKCEPILMPCKRRKGCRLVRLDQDRSRAALPTSTVRPSRVNYVVSARPSRFDFCRVNVCRKFSENPNPNWRWVETNEVTMGIRVRYSNWGNCLKILRSVVVGMFYCAVTNCWRGWGRTIRGSAGSPLFDWDSRIEWLQNIAGQWQKFRWNMQAVEWGRTTVNFPWDFERGKGIARLIVNKRRGERGGRMIVEFFDFTQFNLCFIFLIGKVLINAFK